MAVYDLMFVRVGMGVALWLSSAHGCAAALTAIVAVAVAAVRALVLMCAAMMAMRALTFVSVAVMAVHTQLLMSVAVMAVPAWCSRAWP